MEKKIPMRTCIGCRNVRPKNEMIRIVRTKDGLVEPDITGKAEGRGAYVCKNAECFLKLRKTKALNRTFKTSVSEETYEKIRPAFDT